MSNSYFSLASGNFTQNWTDVSQISADDNWAGVASIVGYRGDELTGGTGTDPRTLTANDTLRVVDVIANQTNPNTLTTGGVAEFQITDPTIALNGSGTADAPYLVLHLDASGRQSVQLTFDARDIDGSTDNAAQQIAVQYRIGDSGSWNNVTGGYLADASVGPGLTGSQNVSVTLPADANNQAQVQVRIITTNAIGSDEWIGIDNILVSSEAGNTGGPLPSISVAATDATASENGDTATFTFTRTGDASVALAVDYTVSGSAGSSDYSLAPSGNQVTFAAGSAAATVTLNVADDALAEGAESVIVTLVDGAAYDLGAATATASIGDNEFTPIYSIQGAQHFSDYDNQTVTTRGIVTMVASNGYYLQDATGDGNIATSDGVFVFTGSAPAVLAGDEVQVSGTVDEFRPGGTGGIDNLTITQIVSPTTSVLSSGNPMPISTLLGDGGRLPPLAVINDETPGAFDPANFDAVNDGLDFYESLEGMVITMSGTIRVVGPTNSFGEIWVTTVNDVLSTNDRGGVTISPADFNPQRIQIDGIGSTAVPQVDVGALLNAVTGVVSYSFGNYEVLVNTTPTVAAASTIAREVTDIVASATTLTYGSVNAENLDPSDGAAKFEGLAAQIVTNMKAPTIIALQEMQDNSGAANNGVTSASMTAQMLIDAIVAAGGPTYSYIDVAPANNTSGGEPGGNIRVGYLYQDAVVDIVPDPVSGALAKSLDTAAFDGSRDPLVVTFAFNGENFTFINNHFTSKGADTGLYENTQPPALNSETQRVPQAQAVNDYVDGLLATDASAKIIVLGDLNDFTWSKPLKTLDGSINGGTKILFELGEEKIADAAERYSYVFEGNSQELDHVYVSQAVLARTGGFDVVHVNAEFASQFSDHDPAVASILGNAKPVAMDDAVAVNEDAFVAGAVLGNDSDADGDALSASILTGPANGTLTFKADGKFLYKPNANFNGGDNFTYQVSDGKGGVDTGSVAITVDALDEVTVAGVANGGPGALTPTGDLTFTRLSTIALSGAEIAGFDPVSKKMFVTSNSGLNVVDMSNPAAPVSLGTIDPTTLGFSSKDVSSVAVKNGVVAASIIATDKTQPGTVIFLNAATGALLGSATVGANPDQVTFTPDGGKLLVANEGEIAASGADAPGSLSVIDLSGGFAAPTVQTASFGAFDGLEAALREQGIRIFQGKTASLDLEPEYISVTPDGLTAMVTLQEANAVAVFDIASATFTALVPLGLKNFAGLMADFSDRDGPGNSALMNLTTGNPVSGMYMPDAIASYSANGKIYHVMANEGDDRDDFLNPDETIRVGASGYDLDNTAFPNEAALKANAALGRLTVSNAPGLRGDTDGDGDIDQILAYGARSFSIVDENGNRVFDSSDVIERAIAQLAPSAFDDTRSDNKGPEPEGISLAKINDRTYAFVGLERSNGVMVFDVTDPANVTLTNYVSNAGDIAPEGLLTIAAADSPTGKTLLVTANETSNTLTTFEVKPMVAPYTLQLLSYYGESGLLGTKTAPIMGALIDKFDDQYANTLVLGEGDNWIPGPWLIAGADPSLSAVAGIGATALARPDVAIMNAFGTDATALGNHEFDLGSPVVQAAYQASGAWVGAQFPIITANVNFSADSSLRGIADASLGGTATNNFAGKETTAIKAKIAPYAISTQGGEKIGIVGLTTWDLLTKTSPNGAIPKDDANPATSDLQEAANFVQGAVDALKAMGVNKIVMVDQLDTLQRNKDLAGLVSGIDVMVAGGGHERLGDSTDVAVAFNGHDADFISTDTYPITTVGADGKPVLIVTTDTEYTYLSRLVVNFDENGEIILGDLDPAINGAYASTETTLQAAYGTTDSAETIVAGSAIGAKVDAITDAINNVIISKDSVIYGYTNVYLEGDRVFGRTEEVNLGNISADANRAVAADAMDDQPFVVSLKNGGGIRASIGSVDANGGKIPPLGSDVKPAGAISQLDVENALRFDNKLMVFDTTAQGLMNIFNFASGLSNGPNQQSGGYPQVAGARFSYDPDFTNGQKLVNLSLVNENDEVTARIVENGMLVDNAPSTISVVSLSFTANGGDGYPIKANAENFRYLLTDGTLSAPVNEALDFTSAAAAASVGKTLADILGEQKAFQDYLLENHATPATAYGAADTAAAQDMRIQNLNRVAEDKVFEGETLKGSNAGDEISGTAGDDDLFGYGGNNTMDGGAGDDTLTSANGADFLYGGRGNDHIIAGRGVDHVEGGKGSDVATGGLDNDLFVFAADDLSAGATDYITEFSVGGDMLSFFGGEGNAISIVSATRSYLPAAAFNGIDLSNGANSQDVTLTVMNTAGVTQSIVMLDSWSSSKNALWVSQLSSLGYNDPIALISAV